MKFEMKLNRKRYEELDTDSKECGQITDQKGQVYSVFH